MVKKFHIFCGLLGNRETFLVNFVTLCLNMALIMQISIDNSCGVTVPRIVVSGKFYLFTNYW